jgi:hypothetical protein
MTCGLIKKGPKGRNVDIETHTEQDDMKTRGEHSHLQIKERGLEQVLPSQSSEGTSSTDNLILDFFSRTKTINFCFGSHPELTS